MRDVKGSDGVPWSGTFGSALPVRGADRLALDEFITTNPVFNTGVEVIDNEHRRIVDRLEYLARAIDARCSKAVIEQFLVEFIDLAMVHFEDEEGVMEEVGYPALEEHRAEHEWLMIELRRVVDEFKELKAFPFVEMLDWLWYWTVFHLIDCDSGYLPYLFRWEGDRARKTGCQEL